MFAKKSKLYLYTIITALSFLLLNCSAVISPLPVGIYSSAKFPLDYESGYNGDAEYKVIGTAVGKATATSIFGLFATGDASISTAYQNAINQFPEANCLIEIAIDYSTSSFIGLFASVTTIVKGKAIQFQKLAYKVEPQKEAFPKEDKKVFISDEKKEMKAPDSAVPKETIKTETEPISKISPSSKESEFIGQWRLVSTKLPDGKILESGSGLQGILILAGDRNVKLIFDQGGRKVAFDGRFYLDDKGSMNIEVEQSDAPHPRSKIYYRDMQIKDAVLILRSETGREYHWKK